MLSLTVILIGFCAVVSFALLTTVALAAVWVIAQERQVSSKSQ